MASRNLDAIFGEPRKLAQWIDSAALNDLPSRTAGLREVEATGVRTQRQAAQLAKGTRVLLDRCVGQRARLRP